MIFPRRAASAQHSRLDCVARAAFFVLAMQGTLLAEDPANSTWTYKPESLRPFWRGNRVVGESVLFIQDSPAGQASASVLFPVLKVIGVRNSAGTLTYEEGRDYTWKPGARELVLPSGSRIVSRTPDELRRPAGSQKYKLTHRDGKGEILFGGRLEYADMQTCITYQHEEGLWISPVPKFDAGALPRTIGKLLNKQPLSIVVLGDSISAGWNASLLGAGPPFQPAYPELLQLHLQTRFKSRIDLKNLSVSGMATGWGPSQVPKVIQADPDLVILAFGMNDSAGLPAKDYRGNTRKMIDMIRAKRPDAEFILVASMLGNRDWTTLHHELFPAYRDALAALCEPGIALADLTSVWKRFLELKRDWDHTGNGVNHPNDFGHRVYAQVIASLLDPGEE